MALSPEAEEALQMAVEAAYVAQAPETRMEDRELAAKACANHWADYFALKDDGEDWWDGECILFPDSARCKLYDV
jgi:hypothetical protein